MSTTIRNSPALWTACANGDETARDSLAREHMSLVHHVANRLLRQLAPDAELDELLSAGRLGLLRAIETFDTSRGLAFSTYAVPRIQGAILDELRRLDVLTRGARKKAREIAAARQELMSQLGRTPRADEVASRMDIDVQTLWRWEAEVDASVPVAMDRPARSEDGEPRNLGELLLDEDGEIPGERLEREETLAQLRTALERLSEQERTVLALSYFEELKLQEIGEVLGITDSRVSQIRSRALRRLRDIMEPAAAVA
jgi:RNA polymerase sigma factor FliA